MCEGEGFESVFLYFVVMHTTDTADWDIEEVEMGAGCFDTG